MADDADRAQQDQEIYDARVSYKYNIPKGVPGDCDECGEFSPRLIGNTCPQCRDRIARCRERNGRPG